MKIGFPRFPWVGGKDPFFLTFKTANGLNPDEYLGQNPDILMHFSFGLPCPPGRGRPEQRCGAERAQREGPDASNLMPELMARGHPNWLGIYMYLLGIILLLYSKSLYQIISVYQLYPWSIA